MKASRQRGKGGLHAKEWCWSFFTEICEQCKPEIVRELSALLVLTSVLVRMAMVWECRHIIRDSLPWWLFGDYVFLLVQLHLLKPVLPRPSWNMVCLVVPRFAASISDSSDQAEKQ